MAKHELCKEMVQYIVMEQLSRPQDMHSIYGPVGLFIQQLNMHNLMFGADLVIRQIGEPDINIWQLPWQHLKRALYDAVSRHRAVNVDNERTFHGHVGEIDSCIAKSVVNKFATHEKHVLRYVNTGAFWSEGQLGDIGRSDGSCIHCGSPNVGAAHVLWNCDKVNCHRKFKGLANVRAEVLPTCIQFGIPAAMTACFHQPYWGEDLQPTIQLQPHEAKAIGVPQGSKHTYAATCDNKVLKGILDREGICMSRTHRILRCLIHASFVRPLTSMCLQTVAGNTHSHITLPLVERVCGGPVVS